MSQTGLEVLQNIRSAMCILKETPDKMAKRLLLQEEDEVVLLKRRVEVLEQQVAMLFAIDKSILEAKEDKHEPKIS